MGGDVTVRSNSRAERVWPILRYVSRVRVVVLGPREWLFLLTLSRREVGDVIRILLLRWRRRRTFKLSTTNQLQDVQMWARFRCRGEHL